MSLMHARSRGYALLSRLLLDGVDRDTAEALHGVAFLSTALAQAPSLDELASAHHSLFALEVPPHEGVFLDAEGLIGGEHAARIHDLYRASGFTAERRDTSLGHLGVMLGALAFLTGAAADAADDGEHARASDVDGRILTLMDEHLLRWLPAFAVPALAHSDGFWRVTIELMLELVSDHRSALDPPCLAPVPLSESQPLLDDERTSLRGIARYLTTASSAGAYLTKTDIENLARRVHIPRGFGRRRDMLESLLAAAAEYDSFATVIEEVQALLDARGHALELLGARHAPLAPFAAPWIDRITNTGAMLSTMIRRAQGSATAPSPERRLQS